MREHKVVDIVTENMTLGKDHLALLSDLLETQKKLTAERDAALKACAEMREALESANAAVWDGHYSGKGVVVEYARAIDKEVKHALSSDCGKEYKSPNEIKAMLTPTIELLKHDGHVTIPEDKTCRWCQELSRLESLVKGAQ